MPYDGLFSFLPTLHMTKKIPLCVSMPYDGLFSFLLEEPPCLRSYSCRCQCPMTGFFHFYRYFGIKTTLTEDGVNALWRAFFISTEDILQQLVDSRGCQCPMTGFFHFYRYRVRSSVHKYTVSMPYDGLFSFLRIRWYGRRKRSRCQCPMTGFFHFYNLQLY